MADYSLTPNIDPEIKKLIDDYFDVMHFQDMEKFDRVFHKDCTLYSAQGGTISLRPYDVYREAVANRESPASKGERRDDRVLMFDQISPTLALVKPQLEMFGGVMQDYLNLVWIDGQWWVLAKMWEKVGDIS
ncbi:MAG: nuclear transport factor 2 family protein [Candidatus Nanopelagicales bacterium]